MRQQYLQLRKIDGNIVDVDGIAIFVARAGKNRGPGVKHYRDTVGLGGAVDDLQLFDAVQVVVGKEQLMRRVNLDEPDTEPHDVLHIRQNIGGVARMVLGGVASGFVLYVATRLVEDLGAAGILSTTIAAWSPAVIGSLLGTLALLYQEDG